MLTDSSFAGLVPGTPKNTCARCRPRRRWPDLGVPRVAACPHTTARSSPAPSRCHKSPRPAVFPWDALRRVRTVGTQDYFETFAASVPSCMTTSQLLFSRGERSCERKCGCGSRLINVREEVLGQAMAAWRINATVTFYPHSRNPFYMQHEL